MSSGPAAEEGEPSIIYSLRFAARAARDLDEIRVRIADTHGDAASFAWDDGFGRLFRSLSTNPRRYAVPLDAQGFAGDVRHVTYRREAGTAPYRLIYKVIDIGEEGRQVVLIHVRHGAARPVTKREAREIEAQNR